MDFRLNMQRDAEAPREIDVAIARRRGRIRVEMGLIERGNQEVIEDKITRVGTGGMVIFDRIGPRSNARQTAANHQVCFIQIRNNRPLAEMHDFLSERVGKMLRLAVGYRPHRGSGKCAAGRPLYFGLAAPLNRHRFALLRPAAIFILRRQ